MEPTVPAKMWQSCGTRASRSRCSSGATALRFSPLKRTSPSPGSRKRITRLAMVVFPAPEGPTRLIERPGSRARVMSSSTFSSP